MAGGIPRLVNVVNRTTEPIDGMFDGQPIVLEPGYKEIEEGGKRSIVGAGPGGSILMNALPYFAAELIKRQNPVMGTEDPEDPRDFQSLVGVPEWKDDIDFIQQSDAEERLDRELLSEEAGTARRIMTTAGRRKKKNRGKVADPRLRNPGGIRADYND